MIDPTTLEELRTRFDALEQEVAGLKAVLTEKGLTPCAHEFMAVCLVGNPLPIGQCRKCGHRP